MLGHRLTIAQLDLSKFLRAGLDIKVSRDILKAAKVVSMRRAVRKCKIPHGQGYGHLSGYVNFSIDSEFAVVNACRDIFW